MSTAVLFLALVSPLAFLAFVRLEERGRSEIPFFVVLALLLVEAIVYPSQNSVPNGIFHPSVAGQSMRLPELLIPLALAARVFGRGSPRRIGGTAGAWTVFLMWYAACFLVGVLQHNSFDEAFFEAKGIIYLGGGFALGVGVAPERLVNPKTVRVVAGIVGIVIGAITPAALADTSLNLAVPLVPHASIGHLGPDLATIVVTIALAAVLLEATRTRRRAALVLLCVPAFVSPFVAEQRAAVLGLAIATVCVVVAAIGGTWRRRILATGTEAILLVAIVITPLLLMTSARAADPNPPDERSVIPYADVIGDTFFAERKVQSADTRKNLWREGIRLAKERPITGLGLGTIYDVPRAGQREHLVGGGFHNILVDVLVRSGLVGLVLFLVAASFSVRDAIVGWRRHRDRAVGVLALACGAAMVGLLGKGLVESVFEKFRLAVLLGLLLGLVSAIAADARRTEDRFEFSEALGSAAAE